MKTRLGTVRTPYEHFYAWRRVENEDKVSTMPFDELETMVKGVYRPDRFLEIFRDYVYFQDKNYDSDEKEIVCRYPQFFVLTYQIQTSNKIIFINPNLKNPSQNFARGFYIFRTGATEPWT